MRETLGQIIHSRRTALSLTQQQLANLAGCRRLLIHELETGKTDVRLSNLTQILHALGLQIAIEPGQGNIVERQV